VTDGVVDGCDPVVTTPISPFLEDEPPPVDAHAPVFGEQAAPFAVRLTWPSYDPSTSIAFLWRTDPETLATVVELTPEGGPTQTIEGVSFRFGGADLRYRMHEIRLCGELQPDTAYTYRVGGPGHWSPERRFRTPPPPGTFDSFRVAIFGDSRGGYAQWGNIARQADTHEPDFLVFTGDMVDRGHSQEEWDAWFTEAEEVLARRVLVPTHGNHELLAVNYFAAFALPGNEQWFHHRYGDLVLVSLNDTVSDLAHREVDQVAYLEQVWGQAPEGAYKVAMHHQALYSANARHGSNERVRELWAPVFDRHGAHLDLAGHNHTYERSVPIRDGAQVPDGEGTVYIVSGGAGAPLYRSTDERWFNAVANPVEHYLIADFGPTSIQVVARDVAGVVIDSFEVPR